MTNTRISNFITATDAIVGVTRFATTTEINNKSNTYVAVSPYNVNAMITALHILAPG